ncbi:NADH-quinone oxidoreductase subunit NuoG [Aquisalimonas lutea]|uniref:NADH-quinone oxidoreductase subunit NuoG n=1 Tax=Aquisalimonas lutea TaxID=1327750 RepID=UPI0025B6193D|nr:NADH-quinone oxidoreductase subunit NuoG [Aquisalimonas lutea]MDN3518846.1 NADH-quinone oxidoreductase subunit NuoG [Aquisalimonas lutea]
MTDNAEATNPETVTIEVDGRELEVPKGSMLIEATDNADIHVPRFCYHRKLSVVANCRMCLVDVEKAPKPLPACATPVAEGMKVRTRSERALKAQKGVMEFLLINHPLDCPICDQGGECELQDLALGYGRGVSRFTERKRAVEDEDLGPLISTEMTRCIHCTRCVRFLEEVAGTRELAALNRGEHTEIGTYVGAGVHSEMSGNIIDLCPVGALTSKPYRFSARSWEMLSHPSVSAHDCVGSNLQIHHVRGAIKRIVPRDNESVNECWIADRDRFAYEGVYSGERLQAPMVRDDSGAWQETDWETALEVAGEHLKGVVTREGGDALGTLVGPTATIEEMYLAGRLTRGLGSANIDARLREADFSDQDRSGTFPALGIELEALDGVEAALLVGSEPRWDQPIVNHRLRKAALQGGAIMSLNYRAQDLNYPLAAERVAAPADMVAEFAAVAAALLETATGRQAPEGLDDLLAGAQVGEAHRAMAARLRDNARTAVLLGQGVQAHPRGAVLRMLGTLVADLSDSRFGILTDGPNQAGAWLAGAVPHRDAGGQPASQPGLDARAMTEAPRQGYLVLGAEPERDCWDGAAAEAALRQAASVVCLTAFVTDAMREYAQVLLPVGTFGETAGTYVSAEGRWQSFPGVAQPVGEARPAWKVLRVLGNVLELDGFEYDAPDAITDELAERCREETPSARVEWLAPGREAAAEDGLYRVGLVPIYGGDALVRRAPALQRTRHATEQGVRISAATAQQQGLADADRVQVQQGGHSTVLPLIIDDALADGAVWVPAGLTATAGLGPMFGPVALARA